jgi:hypothetical protein
MNSYYAAVSNSGRYHATTAVTSLSQIKTLCGADAWTEESATKEQTTARFDGQGYIYNSQMVECSKCEKKVAA